MTTTVMRDSIVGDTWIQQTAAAVPVQRIVDQATGNFNGDIRTGPVRLAFDNLFQPPAPKPNQQSAPKFGATLLFTPWADFTIFQEEYYKLCGQQFPEYYDTGSGQYYGLHSPFLQQAEKVKHGGFTPGLICMNCTSKYKPPIVDARMNPIVDTSKVYPGVWAICTLRAYGYGKNPPQPKKGVAFGLQSVMIIGDDTKFGGGAPDPRKQYAGVNVAAPVVRPDFANIPVGGAPAPAPGIPGYTAPGGGVPQMPGVTHAPIPQQHYTPGQGFTQPPAGVPTASAPLPGAYAPTATTYPTNPDDDMSFLN